MESFVVRLLSVGAAVWLVLGSAFARAADFAPEAQQAETAFSPETPADVAPMPPNGPLTLDQAVQRCLMNDPKLRGGLEGIRQACADRWTASLAPNPELNVGAGLLPLERPYTETEPGGPSEFDLGFSYSIDWFLFGKRAAAMASASIGVGVSQAEYADLVRQRVTASMLAFYDVLEARDLLDLARQDLANMERVEAVTAKAVENGGRPKVELSRVRLDLLNVRRALRDAESSLIASKAKLRAMLGGNPEDATLEVAGTLDGPLTAEPLSPAEAYEEAVHNRPDVLAFRRKVSKANADIVVERRNAFPEVTSDFGFARQYQRPLGSPDVSAWGTGLTVSVPIFNRNQGNRAKAVSTASQSNCELQAALLELRAEVEEAVVTLRAAKANAASVAQDELGLATQVRDGINQAYEAGGRPLIDALDAQRNFRETYRIYISTRAAYRRALCSYNSALGKQATQ